MPQLISSYCSLLLDGRVEPDVKEELRPAIWGAMEVVNIDALKAMSEGMGRDERAVWDSLYKEWRRLKGRYGT